MSEKPIVVWSEIPVSDLKKSIKYYNAVFGYDMQITEGGPNPIAVLGNNTSDAGGHLYPGKPAVGIGMTLHLAVQGKLEQAMQRCADAGGKVASEPIDIPQGRFAYTLDLDGNSIGLFEPKG